MSRTMALFIKPIRYRNFMPLLIDMEHRYGSDKEAFLREIEWFVEENFKEIKKRETDFVFFKQDEFHQREQMKKELCDFVDELYRCGDRPSNWDIALSDKILSSMDDILRDLTTQNVYLRLYHRKDSDL